MPVSTFVAYIDESGDEGFKFEAGSSHWFVLSALILRKSQDLEMVGQVAKIRQLLGKPEKHALHFRNLNHDQRVAFVNEIAKTDYRAISVVVHKPSFANPATFKSAYRLYHYAVRFLLERIGWYCRDNQPFPCEGNGTVDLVFSNRRRMSYEAIRNYLELLLANAKIEYEGEPVTDIRLVHSVIRPDQISAPVANSRAGLQLADAIASSCYYGLEKSKYNTIEPRYAITIKPVIYCRKGNYLSYGFKCFPAKDGFEKINADLKWIGETFR